ncbi:hypothetical protein CFter6_2505 [Collimonas fungivorans]|uniref:Uncharacterized protein n=1 Tax=Collimonas fungivorans TaxID=158899 RepID=A0A127PBS4_9BURK|nr:hypothetical protein [Collimonas fungivorans]AMO95177.1 hypothetical protein CFter6_2505 [Collimonas fungivorans]
MRTACASAAMDFQAGVAAGRRMAWPENYPGLDLAYLQMQRPPTAAKNTQYISQHHHWLRLVQQYIHPAVLREVRQEVLQGSLQGVLQGVLQDAQRQIESRFEKHYMPRLQQALLLAVPAKMPGSGSLPAPAGKAGSQAAGKNRNILQRMVQNHIRHFRDTQADATLGQAGGIIVHPLTLLMPRAQTARLQQSTRRRDNEVGSRTLMTIVTARLAGFVRQTLLSAPGKLRQPVPQRHSALQFAKQAAPASIASRSSQAGHPASNSLSLKFHAKTAQRMTSGMRLHQRHFHHLDRRDIDQTHEQHFKMRKTPALPRRETAQRRAVPALQLASGNRSRDFRTAGSRLAWRSQVQRWAGRAQGTFAYAYKSTFPALPATGAETGSKRLQRLTTPSLPPPIVAAAPSPMSIPGVAGPAGSDQVSLRHYQAGFTAALAYRQQPQARQAEVQRQLERIEHTVHTKVVREIMHNNHNQQHIRSVVTAAMLSPQLVQALARQVHASIEQRAGIDRYRRGR